MGASWEASGQYAGSGRDEGKSGLKKLQTFAKPVFVHDFNEMWNCSNLMLCEGSEQPCCIMLFSPDSQVVAVRFTLNNL